MQTNTTLPVANAAGSCHKGVTHLKPILGIDIETYSPVLLPKTGVYRYVDSDEFEILLFSYPPLQDEGSSRVAYTSNDIIQYSRGGFNNSLQLFSGYDIPFYV